MWYFSNFWQKNSSEFKNINGLVNDLKHRGPDDMTIRIPDQSKQLIFGHNRVKNCSDLSRKPIRILL